MKKTTTVLTKNTFIVKDGNSYIVYNPFSNKITRIEEHPLDNNKLYQSLQRLGFFGKLPETTLMDSGWGGFTTLTLLITRRCNLSCGYCYAKATPYGEHMPIELAINSASWFINQLKGNHIRVTFHGGGEPTLEQDLIKATYEYIEQIRKDRKSSYLITTNGTSSEEFLTWMMKYKFNISISIDGPPDIQNRNRPLFGGGGSSDFVERSIKSLVAHNYPFSVRITYSPVDDIEKIFNYFATLGIKKIHLEPLFPFGRLYEYRGFGEKSGYKIYPPNSEELIAKFLQAIDYARLLGIRIYNGHLMNFTRGIGYFCGSASARAMVVTHDGFLTGCLEVVDKNTEDFETFSIGQYDPEIRNFEINLDKIMLMKKRHADHLCRCKSCYARYNCAGGCSVKAFRTTRNFFGHDSHYCEFTKTIIPLLIRRIAKESGI